MEPKKEMEMSFLCVNEKGQLICDTVSVDLEVIGIVSDMFGDRFILEKIK